METLREYSIYIYFFIVLVLFFIVWYVFSEAPETPEVVNNTTANIKNTNRSDKVSSNKSFGFGDSSKSTIINSNSRAPISVCFNDDIAEVEEIEEIGEIGEIGEIEGNKKGKGRMISRGERICCEVMEEIYGVKFKTVRPNWLKNPETNRNLELDCYNDELRIAVEYNGIQHYKWPNFTQQSQEQFMSQVKRDQLKSKLCELNNVYLITVPYTITHDKIKDFIIQHLPETIKKRLFNYSSKE